MGCVWGGHWARVEALAIAACLACAPSPNTARSYARRNARVKQITHSGYAARDRIEDMPSRRRIPEMPPPEWKAAARAQMAVREWSDAQLARAAGVAPPSIFRLWAGGASWDTVVRVGEVLGMRPPVVVAPGSTAAKVVDLPEDDQAVVDALIESLRQRRAAEREPAPGPTPPQSTPPKPRGAKPTASR